MLVRIDRHAHGPRLYVAGRRLHECHAGLVVLALALGGYAVDAWGTSVAFWIAVGVGCWLVAKDWRDLVPALRDTGRWDVGLHRRAAPLRAMRYADGLPSIAGWVAFAVGVVNLASALTPNIAWRHHVLMHALPLRAVPLFHTLAVPASVALIVTSWSLRNRRRRALQVAVALLAALGVLDLLKGLDIEEALLSWAAAGLLWWARDAFVVRHARLRLRSPLTLFGIVLVAAGAVSSVAVWLAGGRHAEPTTVVHTTLDLFGWAHGSIVFRDEAGALPIVLGLITVVAIVVGGYLLFRPLPASRLPADEGERTAATGLVQAHGSDTLAFFKLRRDMRYLFEPGGRAFLGYRIEGNVLLVAGDPVGPDDALPALLRETLAFAEVHGLRVAVLGARESLLPLWRDAGLRSLYLGDEAIVDTAAFSLEGRPIRKVRQSVTRLRKAGYTAEVHELDELDAATLAQLEHMGSLWRGGGPERGFTMAMDALTSAADSTVVLARDETGVVRGFLHFVPTYGRAAVSLSFMRRDRDTPNGLTEFLVVAAIEQLRERGVEELSLNFAAFGRLLERPSGRIERVLGRLVSLGSRYFQMESLYRFNAKFSPRWEARYFVFESVLALPRAGLAALWAEGQLPRLRPGGRA